MPEVPAATAHILSQGILVLASHSVASALWCQLCLDLMQDDLVWPNQHREARQGLSWSRGASGWWRTTQTIGRLSFGRQTPSRPSTSTTVPAVLFRCVECPAGHVVHESHDSKEKQGITEFEKALDGGSIQFLELRQAKHDCTLAGDCSTGPVTRCQCMSGKHHKRGHEVDHV